MQDEEQYLRKIQTMAICHLYHSFLNIYCLLHNDCHVDYLKQSCFKQQQ